MITTERSESPKEFVSFDRLPLINRLVQDEAQIRNCSSSTIINKHLLDYYLPAEETARDLVESYLFAENENGIANTLEAIFKVNSAGQYCYSVHANLLPIVQFALRQQLQFNTVPTGQEKELVHFCQQFDSIIRKLRESEENAEKYSKQYFFLRDEIKYAEEIFRTANEEPVLLRYHNVYRIIIDNWNELNNLSVTYRLLADMVLMEKGWINTPELRMELLELIKSVSDEWTD